jgi:hypothetical protein
MISLFLDFPTQIVLLVESHTVRIASGNNQMKSRNIQLQTHTTMEPMCKMYQFWMVAQEVMVVIHHYVCWRNNGCRSPPNATNTTV